MNPDPLATIQELAELIEAIDRRSPQLQRSGEAAVIDAATRLRIAARARITELEVLLRDGSNTLPGLDRPTGDIQLSLIEIVAPIPSGGH